MRFKRCIYCHTIITKETRVGDFCSKKCLIKYYKKITNGKKISEDIQKLITDMKITPLWYKLMEQDVKAKRKAKELGEIDERKGIY